MTISRTEAEYLATGIVRARADGVASGLLKPWDKPGIIAAILECRGMPLLAVGAAAYRIAARTDLRTPVALAQPGPHWEGTSVASQRQPARCAEEGHENEPAGDCPRCRAAKADGAWGAALVKAALAQAPRYVEPAVKASRAAERRGARARQVGRSTESPRASALDPHTAAR